MQNLELKTVKDWIIFIKKEIEKDDSRKRRIEIFEKYKVFLENKLKENPKDVEVICQFAYIHEELILNCKKIYKILEKFLKKYDNELTYKEKLRIYENLAYYYYEYGIVKKALRLLKKLKKLNPDNIRIYYFLARIYYKKNKIKKSLNAYKKAYVLNKNKLDCKNYNYAVTLIENKEYENAKIILEMFIKKSKINEDEVAKKYITFSSIICKCYLNEIENIENEIDKLLPVDTIYETDLGINETEILELYFLSKNYKKYVEIYKNNIDNWDYLYFPWSLEYYFYALKQLGDLNNLKVEFEKSIQRFNENIRKIESKEDDYENYSESTNLEFIFDEKEYIEKTKKNYEKILNTNYVPKIKILPKFIQSCFLLDCPLCQEIEKVGVI